MSGREIKTLKLLKNTLKILPMTFLRKSNFFTLVVEVAKNIDSLPVNLKDKLLDLENILDNRQNSGSEYSKYYSYMYQATHGRTARVTRADFFKRNVLQQL